MEFLKHLLGDTTLSFYAASLIFIFLGFITNKAIVFRNRTNKETRFSWKYWLKDNYVDVVLALLLSIATVRFTEDILSFVGKYTNFDIKAVRDTMFYYYVVGIGHQTLLHLARKKFPFLKSKTE